MSRLKGKRPPKYQAGGDYPKTCYLSYERIREIPLGSLVAVRMPDGDTVAGRLTHHSDYLVGCPVVDIGRERSLGVGYECEIVGLQK